MIDLADRPEIARRLLAVVLVTLGSGCSFTSVQRPRAAAAIEDPRIPDNCTTSSQAPIADTVLGATGLLVGYVATVVALMDDVDCADATTSNCHSGNVAPGLATLAAGALFAGSAIYGYVETGKCRHRVRASGRCAGGDITACLKLKPGWAPPPGWRAGPTLQPRPPPASPPVPTPTPQEWTDEPPQRGPTPPAADPR